MKIVELPVSGEVLRLNWDRNKFSAIVPETKESSTLYYDGMKLALGISASSFNTLMDSLESADNTKERIEHLLSAYVFQGEIFNEMNTTSKVHLQHTKWNTEIIKVVEKDSKVKIHCKTNVTSSFLVNEDGAQVTKTILYEKKHLISKCKTLSLMRSFILDSLNRDLLKNTPLYRNDTVRWRDICDNSKYGEFYYFYLRDIKIPVYLSPCSYINSIVDGAVLNVELSRFGSIEQGRIANASAEITAHSKLQAARIIALGPMICEKLLQAEAKTSHARSLIENSNGPSTFAESQLKGAALLEESARSMLATGCYY